MSNFQSTFKVTKKDASKRLVWGWGVVSNTADGLPYLDTQGDHIPSDVMLEMALDFQKNSRNADEMHQEQTKGTVWFSVPLTDLVAEAMNYTGKQRGWFVGVQFDQATFAKFERGEYTGFSIGGLLLEKYEVPDGHCLDCEKPDANCACDHKVAA